MTPTPEPRFSQKIRFILQQYKLNRYTLVSLIMHSETVMPRRPRLFIPYYPQHIVVRGHNKDPILARHDDFKFLYKCLREAAEKNQLAVHAWVFMHNHLHLLVTPIDVSSLSKTMQSVGRRYAQYFNKTYHRSGSLWEGRYKSSLVDTEHYLLSCYRYIELNPVRAGIARLPQDYSYSSYQHNACGKNDPIITPHITYKKLTKKGIEAYQKLFEHALSRKELTNIRKGTEKGLGIGQADFLLKVASLL